MQIIVQIVLVLAVIVVSLALMRGGSNARHLAIRRIMLVIFACVAALSIFFPELLTMLARSLGIGRGTDLVLYGLVVSFMVFMATTYQRFRHMETTLTQAFPADRHRRDPPSLAQGCAGDVVDRVLGTSTGN